MTYNQILAEVKEDILYITINREQKLNALNKEVLTELADVIAFAKQSDEVRGVLLTGAGEKAFVAGADISEFQNYNLEEGEGLARSGQTNVFDAIANCPKPFVAAINGFALGGGLELAMACHIRVASDNAKMGLPEVSLGVIPGYGGTQRLPQLIGKGRALEMILSAAMVDANEAYRTGLVNHVVAQDELLSFCNEIAQKIIKNSPTAIKMAINAVNANYKEGVNGFETEIKSFGKCFGTVDFKEGTQAFLEKRKAVFTGE